MSRIVIPNGKYDHFFIRKLNPEKNSKFVRLKHIKIYCWIIVFSDEIIPHKQTTNESCKIKVLHQDYFEALGNYQSDIHHYKK